MVKKIFFKEFGSDIQKRLQNISQDDIKRRFEKVSAVAKGFLVRRLFKTQRVQSLITTIKDTLHVAQNLMQEKSMIEGNYTREDVIFNQRILSQVSQSFY